MIVSELIKLLEQQPPNIPVKIYDHHKGLPANPVSVSYFDFTKQNVELTEDDDSEIVIIY